MTGSRIRAARLAAGLTLRELARRAVVDPGYLSQIETGKRAPSPEILARLGDVLGVELDAPAPLRVALELLTSSAPAAVVVEHRAVHQLRLLDDEVGGRDSYPIVADALGKVSDPAVYAEVAQLAGWVAADARLNGAAVRHYVAGVRAAAESGNRVAGANCLSSLAYLLAGSADGVLLARTATQLPGLPATMACLAAERLAWTCARAGDVDACYKALDAADEAWDRRTDAEPDAAYWLSSPEIEIMRGRCYVELRKPLRAVPLLEQVTAGYEWSPREAALYLSYLAEAYDQANEPDAAKATLARARRLLATVRSDRVAERLKPAHGHVTPAPVGRPAETPGFGF
ncbi:MAG TPA: helix-turn-helix domain-containing protein [Micromonosporaceae bacterium]